MNATGPESTPRAAFRSLVLDVDSTLSGIEGIDWLAEQRGEKIAHEIVQLTLAAMQGGMPLERVYGRRLSMLRPRRDEVDALSRAYIAHIAPGAVEAIARFRRADVQVHLVSGGIRPALLRLAYHVGLSPEELHAVSVRFDAVGAYIGYDEQSPLTRSTGKRTVVEQLKLEHPILAVGDGSTDIVMRDVVERFVAYTGFAERATVADAADGIARSFSDLEAMVFA